jgi:hypothetical protein
MVALFVWASKKWCRVKKGQKMYGASMKMVMNWRNLEPFQPVKALQPTCNHDSWQ